ncbi:LysR family transcriptional regulator [Roseomonas sp. 18066]|uniref:LysR family transcriptional regulator n=1 Tax=Roseomonas sp. 18066 TaxID=2681412 RepID=UPI001358EDAD|nr:LysR family transcriptional regulator [Roseomonas sp. 18066]
MILTPREMALFRQVMELGSVTAAAAALNISQPAVSKMLQQAEDRLGFRLFLRQRQRLLPTTEALSLFPEVVSALAGIELVQRLGRDLREGKGGLLSLAVTPTLAHGLVPQLVKQFRQAHPDVALSIRAHPLQEVIRLVIDHRVELGLAMGPVGDSRVMVRDLAERELGCVLPPGHPLSQQESLTAQDLVEETLICVAPHQPVRILLQHAFEQAGLPLTVAIEVSQSSIACALAEEGAGIAVLDGFALMPANARGAQVRPFRPQVAVQARLLQSRRRPLSRQAEGFVGFALRR